MTVQVDQCDDGDGDPVGSVVRFHTYCISVIILN